MPSIYEAYAQKVVNTKNIRPETGGLMLLMLLEADVLTSFISSGRDLDALATITAQRKAMLSPAQRKLIIDLWEAATDMDCTEPSCNLHKPKPK